MKIFRRKDTLQSEVLRLTQQKEKNKSGRKLLFLVFSFFIAYSLYVFQEKPWVLWMVGCCVFFLFGLWKKKKAKQQQKEKVGQPQIGKNKDVPLLLIVIFIIFLSVLGLVCLLHQDTLFFLLGTEVGQLWIRSVLLVFVTCEAVSMSIYFVL